MRGNPLVNVAAVCDVNAKAAENLAASVGAAAYDDINTMFASEALEAVIIATPDNMHAEPVIKAAGAKKAILLEKPFASTLDDAQRMMDAIDKNGVKVQMAHLFRFIPFYINMKNAAANGELGELLSANVTMLNRISVPTKMLSWAGKSSPSWFLLSHAIDAILWINNSRAKTVRARGFKRKLVTLGVDTYDIMKCEAVLENGAVCNFEANWIMPNTHPITAAVHIMVSGTEGSMYADTGDPIERKTTAAEYSIPGILEYEIGGYYCGLRRNMIDAFARTLEYGAPLISSAVDGYNAMEVLCAIDRSIADGGKEITVR
jgi:predicted dehydrogenase